MLKRWLDVRILLAVVLAGLSIVALAQAPQGAPPPAEVKPARQRFAQLVEVPATAAGPQLPLGLH